MAELLFAALPNWAKPRHLNARHDGGRHGEDTKHAVDTGDLSHAPVQKTADLTSVMGDNNRARRSQATPKDFSIGILNGILDDFRSSSVPDKELALPPPRYHAGDHYNNTSSVASFPTRRPNQATWTEALSPRSIGSWSASSRGASQGIGDLEDFNLDAEMDPGQTSYLATRSQKLKSRSPYLWNETVGESYQIAWPAANGNAFQLSALGHDDMLGSTRSESCLSISDSEGRSSDAYSTRTDQWHNEAISISSTGTQEDTNEEKCASEPSGLQDIDLATFGGKDQSLPISSSVEPSSEYPRLSHLHLLTGSIDEIEHERRFAVAIRKQPFRPDFAAQHLFHRLFTPLREVSRSAVSSARMLARSRKHATLLKLKGADEQYLESVSGDNIAGLNLSLEAEPPSMEAVECLRPPTYSSDLSEDQDGVASSATSFDVDHRDQMLNNLMSSFRSALHDHLDNCGLFGHSAGGTRCYGSRTATSNTGNPAGGDGPSRNRASRGLSHSGSGGGTSGSGEGTSGSGGRSSGDNGSGDGGDRRRNKKPRLPRFTRASTPPDSDENFACPFYKHNPQRYRKSKSCPGPGWSTIPRLKEHLYRCHSLPLRCNRCGEFFTSEDLLHGHQRAVPMCELHYFPVSEGVSVTQKEKLKSRKRTKPEETEVEKWKRVYLILFPDADPTTVPSPYYELSEPLPDTTNDYCDFLRTELTPQVRQELATEIARQMDPMEDELRARLPQVVHLVHRGLYRLYHRNRRNEEFLRQAPMPADVAIDVIDPEFSPAEDGDVAADAWLQDFWPMNASTFASNKEDDPGLAAFGLDGGNEVEFDEVLNFGHTASGSSNSGVWQNSANF